MDNKIKDVVEKASASPTGIDVPVLDASKKFPINLICNDDLLPSTSSNNRSVYTQWVHDGSGYVNLYVNSLGQSTWKITPTCQNLFGC